MMRKRIESSVPVEARIDVRFLAEALLFFEKQGKEMRSRSDIVRETFFYLFERENLVPTKSVWESVSFLQERLGVSPRRWESFLLKKQAELSSEGRASSRSEISEEEALAIAKELSSKKESSSEEELSAGE